MIRATHHIPGVGKMLRLPRGWAILGSSLAAWAILTMLVAAVSFGAGQTAEYVSHWVYGVGL